jgi:hypothetical protein
VTAFTPSLEAFSYVTQKAEGGESWLVGRRMKPFGMDALGAGKMPYDMLLVRVQRFAVGVYSKNPDLDAATFERRLGEHMFGASSPAAKDLLEMQRIWTFESDWYYATPLLDPEFFEQRARRLKWPKEKLADYTRNLETLKRIVEAYASSQIGAEKEMANLARRVVERWGGRTPSNLATQP